MLTNDQIQDLIDSDIEGCQSKHFVWRMTATDPDNLDEFLSTIMSDLDDKVLALMINQDTDYSCAERDIYTEEYLVLTDEEADRRADEEAECRAEDALNEIPDYLHEYFDKDEYVADQVRNRGALLDYHDGGEDYEVVNGETYYIYHR